jgi:hypothetical protein
MNRDQRLESRQPRVLNSWAKGMLNGARQTVDLTPPVRFGGRLIGISSLMSAAVGIVEFGLCDGWGGHGGRLHRT